MKLKQIAMDAISEAENEDSKSKIKRTDNGDGTVTLSIAFSLDPKVVAEKAKAMAKGVKRDDMSDDLAFADDVEEDTATDEKPVEKNVEEDEEEEDPYNGVNVEDELFATALDELMADTEVEDAKIGKHGLSPLENCRAKDPRFCPYHGQKAWQSQLENDLKAAGVNGATVTVTEDEHKSHLADSGTGRYSIDVKCNQGDEQKVAGILQGYLQMKGVKDPTFTPAKVGKTARGTHAAVPGRGVVQRKGGADVNFVRDRNAEPTDRYGDIQELVDDMMDNPSMDYGNQEQMDLLNDISDILDNKMAKLIDPQTHAVNNPQDQQTYDDLEHDAFDKYHQLSAMVAYPNVKTMADVDAEVGKFTPQYDSDTKDLDDSLKEINGVKQALGWKPNKYGTFDKPRGMDVAGHKDSMDWMKNVSHFTKETMAEGASELGKAKQAGDVNQARRWMKQMAYAAGNAAYMKQSLGAEKTKYLQSIYDAESKAGNPNIATAFPNGRPQ